MKIAIRVILAALLLGCLYKQSYGYYQFVRIATFIFLLIISFVEFNEKKIFEPIILLCAAILFNPIYKVYFKKPVWNKIDIVLAGVLILLSIFELWQRLRRKEPISMTRN